MKRIIKIEGMMCEHCSNRVFNALSNLKEIKSVKVNLSKNEAIIKGDVDDTTIINVISKTGYKVVLIEEK